MAEITTRTHTLKRALDLALTIPPPHFGMDRKAAIARVEEINVLIDSQHKHRLCRCLPATRCDSWPSFGGAISCASAKTYRRRSRSIAKRWNRQRAWLGRSERGAGRDRDLLE